MVDDASHTKDVPGVSFGHFGLEAVGHHALDGHYRVVRVDLDRVVNKKTILFQSHRYGVGDLVVAVVLGRLNFDPVHDVSSSGDPPSEQSRQPLVRQVFDPAIERHESVSDC